MKKNNFILFSLLLFLILFIFGLSLLKKQIIFVGTIYLKENYDEDGTITKDLYLLSDKKLNIDLINYIILETKQGEMFVNSEKLEYCNSLIKININNIDCLKLPKNNVLIYEQKVSLLFYLLSNIFQKK